MVVVVEVAGGVLWELSGGGGGGGGWRDSIDSSVMPTICTASGKTSKTALVVSANRITMIT